MIEYLNNWTFFILVLTVYLLMIIISSKRLGLFRYINSLFFIKDLAARANKNKFYSETNLFIKNNIITNVKPVYLYSVEKVLTPFVHVSGTMLFISSTKISSLSLVIEEYLSGTLKDTFEVASLLTRKAVNAKNSTVWTAVLIVIVIIYFILTNV